MNNTSSIFNKQNNISFKRLNKRLIILNAFLLLGFFGVQIFVTSFVGTKTQEIDYTRNQKTNLRQQNSFLEAEVAKEKSLTQAQGIIEKYSLSEKEVNFLQEANLQGVALNYNP